MSPGLTVEKTEGEKVQCGQKVGRMNLGLQRWSRSLRGGSIVAVACRAKVGRWEAEEEIQPGVAWHIPTVGQVTRIRAALRLERKSEPDSGVRSG